MLSFFPEKKNPISRIGFLGPAPDPVAPLRGELVTSPKQNKRFLLLFPEFYQQN
jgi:hypothetical protein